MNQTKIDIFGTEADKNTWIYQLGEDGVIVREAEIDSGRPGDPVTIVQLSDLHFNYCDELDMEQNNPTLMSTYKNRIWLANASSVPVAEKSLKYAEMMNADKIIVTGDVLDYLSHGCIRLLERVVWGKYPNALVTAGNHEWVQKMQGTVAESLPLSKRQEMLEAIWAPHHDLYYTSEIINDKIMVIQLENGMNKFWDNQVEPLRADIEKARNEGYCILLFYHISLATVNPAETNVFPIQQSGVDNINFFAGQDCAAGPSSTDATKEIYDMIVDSADVIKACFCGHSHSDYYTEIAAKTKNGDAAVIPQYILTATAYDKGHVLLISVK